MKFIASSKSLWILMEKEKGKTNDDGEYDLVLEKNTFHFNGLSNIQVEAKEDDKMTIDKNQFKRLRKILRAIQEQPVVIYQQGHSLMLSTLYI